MQAGRVWCRVAEARVGARWGPCCAVLLLCACASVSQTGTQSALMQATKAKTSTLQLRATQDMLAVQLPGIFETAADAISAQATDPALRRRALMWKMEVVPAFYQALFNPDPLAAALDTLTLCVQLDQYLERPEVQQELAPLQSLAIQAAKQARRRAEDEMRMEAATSAGFEKAIAIVDKWARAHPIAGPLSSRPSPLGYLADLVAAAGNDVSVFQVVGDIPATVGDIAIRLDIYAAYLPKAVRWQAELLGDELRGQSEIERAVATLVSLQKAADRFNQAVSPEVLQQSLATANADVQMLRQQTQAYVTSEREAALAAVGMERRAVMADVDRQRAALLQEVDALRKQVRQDADELASRIIWRSALAAAALLILAAILTSVALRHALKARA